MKTKQTDGSYKKGQLPLYLGISVMEDSSYKQKLRTILIEGYEMIFEKFNTNTLNDISTAMR